MNIPRDDKRLWSTTAKQLSQFITTIRQHGFQGASGRALQKFLKDSQIYPARDFPECCVAEPPDTFFTYHSSQSYIDVQEIVWKTFDFSADLLRKKRPDLEGEDLELLIAGGIRLWLDFLFIDQSARDISSELLALPILLETAKSHFVIGSHPLSRAWCCYEVALFNRKFATRETRALKSFIAPTRDFYAGWDKTETSEPKDKDFIRERIVEDFPSGFEGFNTVMAEANTSATLSFAEGTGFYSPAAIENLTGTIDSCYSRL